MSHLVVLVAGAGQTAASWDEQVRRVKPCRTLAVSPTDLVEDGPFTFDAAVDGLRERIAGSGASSVTLVGLSLGGMIATGYAGAHPGVVDGLLLSGSQVRPNRALMRVQRTLLRLAPARLLPLPDGLDRATFLRLLDAAATVDLSHDLPGITVPTLVLCGQKDRPNLPGARALASGLPHAELRVLPGGGHHLANDAPDEFARAIHDLLERTGHR